MRADSDCSMKLVRKSSSLRTEYFLLVLIRASGKLGAPTSSSASVILNADEDVGAPSRYFQLNNLFCLITIPALTPY